MNTPIETKYPLATARAYADRVVALLTPHCERIAIAGSIRREKAMVKDIEVVCIPKRVQVDLFGGELVPIPEFCEVVNAWQKVKGEPQGKYTQRILPGELGIKLDLFIATRDNWGLIYAIRTGSAEYSAKILAKGWVNAGYKSEDGILRYQKTGEQVCIREEIELFNLIGLPWCEPENRL